MPDPVTDPARPEIHIPLDEPMEELRRTDHEAFAAEMKALVSEAEANRLRYMRARQRRGFFALSVGMIAMLAGACGFGWYFLMEGDLLRAVGSVAIAAIPTLLFYSWINGPQKAYVRTHKSQFMPKLAKVLGGLRYDAGGGVAAKVLGHTGIVPPHNRYDHEDCFLGVYKGIKVIFSEARLYKGSRSVFRGIFALMELPKPTFSGHLILTADKKMAQDNAGTRWKKLSVIAATSSNPDWNRFLGFSDKPDEAAKLINEKLLKELSEAADIFGRSPISVSFMKGKYIFMMIPNEQDMFEASSVLVPITTTAHIEERRKEIEKLLEVMDVFEIYGK